MEKPPATAAMMRGREQKTRDPYVGFAQSALPLVNEQTSPEEAIRIVLSKPPLGFTEEKDPKIVKRMVEKVLPVLQQMIEKKDEEDARSREIAERIARQNGETL